jgi:hypothetical protein
MARNHDAVILNSLGNTTGGAVDDAVHEHISQQVAQEVAQASTEWHEIDYCIGD